MNVVPRLAFLLVMVLVPAVVYATSGALPARVATHFGPGGGANGFMTREGYLVFMLCFSTVLPLVLVGLIGFVPGVAASQIKGELRRYWLAQERRQRTLAWLGSHACWFGVLLALFLLALHLLTVQANALSPPRLSEPAFFALLGVFLAGLGAWIAILARHFHPRR
jgi:uncharacterized membrane protein